MEKVGAEKLKVRYLPGSNPAIVCYSDSVVKIYGATDSMARFYNKNFQKRHPFEQIKV
jgi:hypothetical protein